MSTTLTAREGAPGASTTAPARAAEPVGPGGRWVALVFIALAQLMVVLDATIVNIALPTAQRALDFSNDDRQWVVTSYALAFGSLLLLGGRLSDFFGRRRMFVIGVTGFALASALGGAAQDFTMLLIARALQGVFAAALAPAALSLLAVTFTEPRERAKAFSIFGAIAGGGGAVGLLAGGLLTEYASWRWCLYVNIVIGAVALVGAAVVLRSGPPATRPRLDLPGALTAVLGVVGIVYGLANSESHGWGSALTWAPLAAGVVVLALFFLVESRVAHPLLPLRVVRDRNRGGAYLTIGIVGIGLFGVFLFLTYYLTTTLGYSPVRTGAAFLPMMGAIIVSATLVGTFLVARVGPRPLVPVGALLGAAGMWWFTRLELDSSYATGVLPALLVIGVGLGLTFAPVQNAAVTGVDPQDVGVASAMINTVQQVGGAIGTAVLSYVAATAATGYVTDNVGAGGVTARLTALGTLDGYRTVFWWSSGVFLLGAIAAALLFRSGPLQGAAKSLPAPDEDAAAVRSADGAHAEDGPHAATQQVPAAPAAVPEPALTVSGTVGRRAGQPLVGAFVTLTDASGHQVGRTTTGDDGSYLLPLTTGGVYVLIVAGEHVQPTAASVVVADRPVTRDVVLAAGSSVTGRVAARWRASALVPVSGRFYGHDGSGLDGAGVHAADDDLWEGVEGAVVTLTDARGDVVATTTTDSRGTYALADLVGGTYVVTAQASGRRPVAAAVTLTDGGGTTCDLHVPAGGHLTTTVSAASDGHQVPEATLTLVDGDGTVVATGTTDREGRATFTDLPPGAYTLTAAGYAPVATTVELREDSTASADVHLGGAR